MDQNQIEKKDKRELSAAEKHKRTKAAILIVFAASLGLLLLYLAVPGLFGESTGGERETAAPVDPSKLYETKDADFDIFEYEEYLKYDRTVYIEDPSMSTTESVDSATLSKHGDGFIHLYELLHLVMEGDVEAYNAMVSSALQKESFTQQQLYDIHVTKHSKGDKTDGEESYTEYVFLVEYKIHENNGSFRNDIEPDAGRPQYFVINDREGRLLLMDVIDILPGK